MAGNKQFLKDSLTIMISEITMKLKGFIFIPIISKLFGPVNYGIWAQIVVLQAITIPIIVFGLDTAAVRFFSGKDRQAMAQAFSSIIFFMFLMTCICSGVIVVLSSQIAAAFFGGEENTKFVLICAVAIFVSPLLSMCKRFILIANLVKTYTVILIMETLLPIMLFIPVLVARLSIIYLIGAEILANGLVAAACLIILKKELGGNLAKISLLPNMLKFGAGVLPAAYAMWILNSSDRLYIAHFYSMKEVGIYSAVYSLGYICISFFINPFYTLYPTRATEFYNSGKISELQMLFRKSTKMVIFFLIPTIGGLYLLGENILEVFTSKEFTRGGNLFLFITIGYTFLMMSSYYSLNIGYAKKPYLSSANMFLCAGINLTLNYFLIIKWEIMGAAIATCISFIIGFIIEYIIAKKVSPIRLRFDWVSIFKATASGIVMVFVLSLIYPQGAANIIKLLLIVLSGAVIYIICQFAMKFVNFEEALKILEILGLKKAADIYPVNYFLLYLK